LAEHEQLRAEQKVPPFIVQLRDGPRVGVKVPPGLKPGMEISILVRDYSKMITSTLQVPPCGSTILLQKPILWATARQSTKHNPDMSVLMGIAQHRLVRQAHTAGCNAVLGISFNVMNNKVEQSEELVISAFGTPCIVAPVTDESTTREASDDSPVKDDDLESCASLADTATESDAAADVLEF